MSKEINIDWLIFALLWRYNKITISTFISISSGGCLQRPCDLIFDLWTFLLMDCGNKWSCFQYNRNTILSFHTNSFVSAVNKITLKKNSKYFSKKVLDKRFECVHHAHSIKHIFRNISTTIYIQIAIVTFLLSCKHETLLDMPPLWAKRIFIFTLTLSVEHACERAFGRKNIALRIFLPHVKFSFVVTVE